MDSRKAPRAGFREPAFVSGHSTPFGDVPFTGADALDLGLRRDDLRDLVARGAVRRVMQGVYVDDCVVDSLQVRAAAAAKVIPAGHVVCGRTAAWLWGIDALAMGAHRILPDVDVMSPAGSSAARRRGVFGSSGSLLAEDVVKIGPTWVTSQARTAADLARLLPRPDALAALDAMLRLPSLQISSILEVLDRFAGHRGIRQARELAAIATPLAESPQESRTRLRCIDAGFPAPEPQIEVFDALAQFVARLDMGWRLKKKAVEFDGADAHGASQQQHDRIRRERAESCGWGICVATAAHIQSRGLTFEYGVAELLGLPFRLTRHHPAVGGWDPRSRWAS